MSSSQWELWPALFVRYCCPPLVAHEMTVSHMATSVIWRRATCFKDWIKQWVMVVTIGTKYKPIQGDVCKSRFNKLHSSHSLFFEYDAPSLSVKLWLQMSCSVDHRTELMLWTVCCVLCKKPVFNSCDRTDVLSREAYRSLFLLSSELILWTRMGGILRLNLRWVGTHSLFLADLSETLQLLLSHSLGLLTLLDLQLHLHFDL